MGSLRIGRQSLHPHGITIPVEELKHWLESYTSVHSANTPMEPLVPQQSLLSDAAGVHGDLLQSADDATDVTRTPHRATESECSFSRLECLSRLNKRLTQSPRWVNGDKLADWWARQRGAATGDERKQFYDEACRSIFRGVLAGEFMGNGGRPHFVRQGSVERVLPAGPNIVDGTWFSGEGNVDALRELVKVLWLPAAAVKVWLSTYRMDSSLWPIIDSKSAINQATTKVAATIAAQTRWQKWLEQQMRDNPTQPRSKAMTRKEGSAAWLPYVSDRGFAAAWGRQPWRRGRRYG